MKDVLVHTRNVQEALKAIDFLLARPVKQIVGMSLLSGPPSTGKTGFGERIAPDRGWIFQRITESDTTKSFFIGLYQNLVYSGTGRHDTVIPRGSTNKIYKSCLSLLQQKPQVIIIDEINNAFRHRSIFNSVRDLVDMSFSIFVLMGESDAYSVLQGMNEHYFDRVNQFVRFKRLNLDDIHLVVDQKSDIEMDDDVINWLMMRTNGKWRQLNKLIFILENFAKSRNQEKLAFDDIPEAIRKNNG